VELGWEHIDLHNIDNVNITRIAVMGPDSRILLRSLEISDDQLQNSGSHLEIDTIMEPVIEFNLKHLNNKTKCILPVSETS
jgi:hypothetical protein